MAVKQIKYNGQRFSINYDLVNAPCEKSIVFLHGWGSNKEIMKQAFAFELREFQHIYIDMPGFGKSPNDYVLTTQDYANVIKIFLTELDLNPKDISIVGHSFGGKVATLLNPLNLILLSTAGILEEKSLKVKIKIKLAKFFKIFGLAKVTKMFRSSDVENMSQHMYETFKNVVNEDFTEHFANFSNNTLIFWGKKDTATSLASGEKISQLIQNSYFKAYDGDHYFFIKNSGDICGIIKDKLV